MDNVPTTYIKTKNGLVLINITEFNEEIHKLATPEEVKKEEAAIAARAAQQTPAPAEVEEPAPEPVEVELKATAIGRNGKHGKAERFVLLDQAGNKFGTAEYHTEAEAAAALTPAQ